MERVGRRGRIGHRCGADEAVLDDIDVGVVVAQSLDGRRLAHENGLCDSLRGGNRLTRHFGSDRRECRSIRRRVKTGFCVAEVKSKAIPAKSTIGTSESAKMIATLALRSRMNCLTKTESRFGMTLH